MTRQLIIGDRVISDDGDCYVIAEIGHNHQGSLKTAIELFKAAAECGVAAAKLQKRAGRLGAPVPAYDGLGGELWDLVRRCRAAGRDPEVELRSVARAFRDRLAELERVVLSEGREPSALSSQEWEALWS